MKNLFFVLFALVIGGLVGCANNPGPSPHSPVPVVVNVTFVMSGHDVKDVTTTSGPAVTPDVNGDFGPVTVLAPSMDLKATSIDHGANISMTANGAAVNTPGPSGAGSAGVLLELKY